MNTCDFAIIVTADLPIEHGYRRPFGIGRRARSGWFQLQAAHRRSACVYASSVNYADDATFLSREKVIHRDPGVVSRRGSSENFFLLVENLWRVFTTLPEKQSRPTTPSGHRRTEAREPTRASRLFLLDEPEKVGADSKDDRLTPGSLAPLRIAAHELTTSGAARRSRSASAARPAACPS